VYPDLEVPRFSFDVLYLGEGEYLDVEMPADLDQFG